jgi:hypothetical protein
MCRITLASTFQSIYRIRSLSPDTIEAVHIDVFARLELALPLLLGLFGFLFHKLIANVSALNLAGGGPAR